MVDVDPAFLLAPYVAVEAIETLIEGATGETYWIGIALTTGTLVHCRWLGRSKQRIGEKLGSRATYGEGTQNMLCAILAAAVALCVREGQKAWRGEECGCATGS
jgi:divalent metal cation (Fe/Co/Zn/Cd) transporter